MESREPDASVSGRAPDFYISAASEMRGDMATIRACWMLRRVPDECRDDRMLIKIDPPIIGQAFGLGGTDIRTVLISARSVGTSLFPMSEWPMRVYVSRLADPGALAEPPATSGSQIIAWAELHRTREDAERAITKR